MHDDATRRFEDRLADIEYDLMRRRLLSAEKTTNLFAQLQSLNEQILRLLPEGEHALDPHRTVRQGLERDARALEQEVHEENIAGWRDVKELRRERREILDQQRASNDRYNFTSIGYD